MMIYSPRWLLLGIHLMTACQSAAQSASTKANPVSMSMAEPPACDCCVFDERVPAFWQGRIAPDTAVGTPLLITGTVYQADGITPAPDVLMYFYHTNTRGYYAKLGTEPRSSHAWWHGYCRGWLKTDKQGRYQLTTIKPGAYPNRTIPAHIHFYVKAPSQRRCYYLSDFVFTGDPFLTETYWYKLEQEEGFLRYQGVSLSLVNDTLVGHRDVHLLPQFDRQPTHSGLTVGENCPAFEPWHVWGPDRGKRTCPMCAYGQGRGVLIWSRSATSAALLRMAHFWEARLQSSQDRSLRAFIIYTNPDHQSPAAVNQLLTRFAQKAGLHKVALLYVPSPEDKASSFLYNINPEVETTVLAYRQRQVISKLVNPQGSDRELSRLLKSLN